MLTIALPAPVIVSNFNYFYHRNAEINESDSDTEDLPLDDGESDQKRGSGLTVSKLNEQQEGEPGAAASGKGGGNGPGQRSLCRTESGRDTGYLSYYYDESHPSSGSNSVTNTTRGDKLPPDISGQLQPHLPNNGSRTRYESASSRREEAGGGGHSVEGEGHTAHEERRRGSVSRTPPTSRTYEHQVDGERSPPHSPRAMRLSHSDSIGGGGGHPHLSRMSHSRGSHGGTPAMHNVQMQVAQVQVVSHAGANIELPYAPNAVVHRNRGQSAKTHGSGFKRNHKKKKESDAALMESNI